MEGSPPSGRQEAQLLPFHGSGILQTWIPRLLPSGRRGESLEDRCRRFSWVGPRSRVHHFCSRSIISHRSQGLTQVQGRSNVSGGQLAYLCPTHPGGKVTSQLTF